MKPSRRGDSFGWHSTNVVVSETGIQFWQGSLVSLPTPCLASVQPSKFRCIKDDRDGEYYPFSQGKQASALDLDLCESVRVKPSDLMLIVAVTAHAVIVHHDETTYAILRHWFVSDYFVVIARSKT